MRAVIWTVIVIVALAAAAFVAVGWIFSTRILEPQPYQLFPEFEIERVTPVGEATFDVTLPLPSGAQPPQHARTDVQGRFGLLWADGAGTLGEVITRSDASVVRRVELTRGAPPEAGDPARMDVTLFATPSDRGLAFEEVLVPGPLGDLPGWWIPGREDDAILVVHGRRRADRTEALRALPTLVADGASVLVLSYRNHDASPASPDGFFHYGASEVDDVLAGVAWLQQRGVRRVAMVGYSMGGGIVVGAQQAWPDDGPELVGLVLDSLIVDPYSVFAQGARNEGLPAPGLLARAATIVGSWRTGVDFAALDRREVAARVDVPVLLFAGVDDTTIPIDTVDEFAARLPNLYAYERLDGVEHVEGWNADAERYEAALSEFLALVFELTAVAEAR